MHLKRASNVDSNLAVCLVDDDDIMQDLVSRYIKRLGFMVSVANEPEIALNFIATGSINAVISDLYMPDIEDGLNFLTTLKKNHPEVPVIVMSSEMSESTQSTLYAAGACACLKKPVSSNDLALALDKVSTH